MPSDERRPPSATIRDDMLATLRTMLLGSKRGERRYTLLIGLGLGLFALTFLVYEFDMFHYYGGAIPISFHSALIGVTAAFWTGYRRVGILFGWILTYLTFLGWLAERATEISPRPLIGRIAFIIQPDGLAALAIIGVIVVIVGFSAGTLARKTIDTFRDGFLNSH